MLANLDLTPVKCRSGIAPLHSAPAGDRLSRLAGKGLPTFLVGEFGKENHMKAWFFIAYHNNAASYCEWEIANCDERFLEDKMHQYIKFSGSVTGGKAYRLSTTTGKPIFSTVTAEAGLPWA